MKQFFMRKRKLCNARLALLISIAVALFSVNVSATAFAQVQQVSLDPASLSVVSGDSFSLAVNYDVDDSNNTLTGVLHHGTIFFF